jgi:nucleoporin NDC1
MGKKTNLQSPNQLLGSAGIKWATANSGRLDIATATGKRKNGPANSKAYAIADVLKTSIYQIVSAFHDEMLAGTKASLLEKDWITSEKPIFGTREMLIQKLRLFLDFRAT